MANWHIEFEIKGTRLDSALSVIHALKPVNLRVVPITELAINSGTLTARIIAAVDKYHTPGDIANYLDVPKKQVGIALANLAKAKKIKRSGYGKYKSL